MGMENLKAPTETRMQPDWPLRLDYSEGPYLPITSLIASLRRDFENLLRTNPGEWPNIPDMGVGIERYLFENYSSLDVGEIRQSVVNQLRKYLPSIKLVDLKLISSPDDQDSNFAKISITYIIEALGENQSLQDFTIGLDASQTEMSEELWAHIGVQRP